MEREGREGLDQEHEGEWKEREGKGLIKSMGGGGGEGLVSIRGLGSILGRKDGLKGWGGGGGGERGA